MHQRGDLDVFNSVNWYDISNGTVVAIAEVDVTGRGRGVGVAWDGNGFVRDRFHGCGQLKALGGLEVGLEIRKMASGGHC